MRGYRELLKEKNFLFYCIALVFSQFGDRLVHIILVGFVHKMSPGSTLQLAKLLTFTIIPAFFISPIAGVYVDRWNKRLIMLVSDIVRFGLVLIAALFFINNGRAAPMYAIIFLIFSSACFFLPAKFSVVPNLVKEEKLLLANSIVYITGIVSGVAGFAIGGLLLEWTGLRGGAFVNAAVYLLSAVSLFFIIVKARKNYQMESVGALSKEITKILKKPFFHELKEGFKYLLSKKDTRFVMYIYFIFMAAMGAAYVVMVVFIQETLGSMTKDVGLFGLAVCLGLLLGSFIYGRIGNKIARNKAILLSLIAGGLFLCLFTLALKLTASFWLGAVFMFLLGTAVSPVAISANTIIHETIDENLRGRIFSSVGIVMNLAMLTFMFITSALAERIDRAWILIFVGIMFSVCGIIGFALDRERKIAT